MEGFKQQKLIGRRGTKLRQRYFKTLKLEYLICLVCAAVLSIIDPVKGYSVLIGGLIHLLPVTWQARRHFDGDAGGSAERALAELYAGQIWKMALMATLFALVFVLIEPLSVFSLFAALILLQMFHLVMQVRAE